MDKYFYDLINSSGNLHFEDIVIRIAFSAIMGIVIYISYKFTHEGTVYSQKFNITLIALTILTTTVMTVIGNNIALSLGMVGALSIIRFRTSIKDSRDTIYIFWTIIVGICSGVGDYTVASVGSAAVFLMLMFFGRVKNDNRILIIVKGSRLLEQDIRKVMFDYFPIAPMLKVKNSTYDKIELIYEINKNMLDKAEKIETKKSLDEQRANRTILDILYALGDIEYSNIVVQNDEIT
ncbi:DUF4956 domain-containing protein [Proteocatella sphenisci]|uniref:DUF4956 domain-containing protein n=1 Tax=Proteocatella sphenisci TaxID=181070 RepID=UPI000490456B|nr:DUF4956 domain-containing protein [Proteocatella sphenisci]